VRAYATAAGVAVAVAGCGGHTPTQRPAVADYIDQVNVIEKQLQKPFQAVTRAGSKFASNKGSASAAHQERSLVGALRQIRSERGRLSALVAPRPAARLHRLLLALIDGEAGMTSELSRLVAFLPRFTSILSSLSPATGKLQSALRVTTPLGFGAAGVSAELAAKANALTKYQFALYHVVKLLERLSPPALSRPQFVTQIKTLEAMQSSAGRLAHALGTGQSNVAPLLHAFDKAAAGNQSVAAQRAQIAAIKAYDARAAKLSKLAQQAEIERTRLANSLK
jgi:hypothetical protein